MKRALAAFGVFVVLTGAVYACGDGSLAALSDGADAPGGSAGSNESPTGKPSDLGPTDNGVILVHAAGAPSFRLCFKNESDRLPQPDSQAMPNANVVGVEVGSAVRIGPLKGAPGQVILFEEPLIREAYPAFGAGGKGPKCKDLLSNVQYSKAAHVLDTITDDYSKGVHVLAIHGCMPKTIGRVYTKEECGDAYDDATGNLAVTSLELKGRYRKSPDELPAQVLHLSQALESSRQGGRIVVSFGDVTSPTAPHTAAATDPRLFALPTDFATTPTFDRSDEAIYASIGIRVSLAAPGDAGAVPQVLTQMTLADIQSLSAPRDIPTEYFSAGSNYVFMLLGDPTPRGDDGGIDIDGGAANDDRRKLHLLAVPVVTPKGDGGADGGPEGGLDGGASPDGS